MASIKDLKLNPPTKKTELTKDNMLKFIKENGSDYLLTSKRMVDYMNLYVKDPRDFNSPYVAPLLAKDLSNQPDTLIITAQYDLLRDEGEAYGKRLYEAGNNVDIYRMNKGEITPFTGKKLKEMYIDSSI